MRSLSSTVAVALDLQAVQGRVEDLDGPTLLAQCRLQLSGAQDCPMNGRSRPEGGFSVHTGWPRALGNDDDRGRRRSMTS